jgi:tetratricopeptide (TPR) repeat protein
LKSDRKAQKRRDFRASLAAAFAITLLALCIRLFNLHIIADNPFFTAPIMDEDYHHRWAVDLLHGHARDYLPFYRAPGYPYLLAGAYRLAGEAIPVGRALSSILGALTVAVTFWIGLRWGLATAILAAGALALMPIALYFDGMLVGAALETLLFVLGVFALIKAREAPPAQSLAWSAAMGLALGLATITRPIMAAVLPVGLVFLWLSWARGRSAALLASAAWALPVIAVTVANKAIGGEWVAVAWNGGINFFLGNNPQANGWSATAPELRPSWWLGYLDAIQVASRAIGHTAAPHEVSSYWYQRGWNFVTSEPGAWLGLMVRKCYLLVNSFELSNNQSIQGFYSYSPLFRNPLLGLGVVLPLATPQFFTRRLWKGPLPWFVVIYGLTVVVFFVTSRYRMPLIPLLLVLAAQTCVEVARSLRTARLGTIARLATPMALAAVISTSDWIGVRDPDVAEQHFNVGNRHAAAGAYDQAIAEYEAAIRARPYHMGAWNNIGTVRLRQGRFADARRVLDQSLALQETAEAHARIGMIYLQESQLDSARIEIERSLDLTPDNPEALYYLGTVNATKGDVDGAIAAWERALSLHPDSSYKENIFYALGKVYVLSGRDLVRGGDYLSRVTQKFPDLEQLKARARVKSTAAPGSERK